MCEEIKSKWRKKPSPSEENASDSPHCSFPLVLQLSCLQCVLKLNKDNEPQLHATHIYTIFLYLTCYNPFQIKSPIMLACSASDIYVPKPQNCVSPAGFICTTQLSLHSRCKPVRQWPAQNYDPEGAGATLLPVWPHHHLPHPRGSGHRYPWGSASFFLTPLRRQAHYGATPSTALLWLAVSRTLRVTCVLNGVFERTFELRGSCFISFLACWILTARCMSEEVIRCQKFTPRFVEHH